MFTRFIKDESGATAIEYGLIAALIAVAIIAGATSLGSQLNAKFDSIATTVETGTAPAAAGSGDGS
ncbi:Flp family type IVb pilin [Ahrensia kielensis]|uniref:Flp family type IVb pilin n=1 Tax=Ahrensia kielensis TaxID=76980 RepID=UPI000372486B|nr:Flp family type IVb pilin [Ahrensia kielensis]